MPVPCPICSSPAEFQFKLERGKIVHALEKFFGVKFQPTIVKTDYSIYQCPACELGFCDPLAAGDEEFYTALTAVPGYYPDDRGEYEIVGEEIKRRHGADARVVDIGCGGGDFLALLKSKGFTRAIGIDTTPSSVEKCRVKGVEAYCERIESSRRGPFDAVVSFHCLEHVEDPVGFVKSALSQLKPDGSLFISTPYSPQCIEYGWYHPLNYPPHHMLRLNLKAYRKLGEVTGTRVSFINFSTASTLSQVRSAFSFAAYGNNIQGSSVKVLGRMLTRPFLALRMFYKVMTRERINGKIAGPDILVVFERVKEK